MGLVEQLMDIENIKKLKAKYCYFMDSGRLDDLAELFTDDGVCEFGPKFGGTYAGRETIRKFFKEVEGGVQPNTVMHAVSNPIIEVDGDSATGKWYLQDYVVKGSEQPLRVLAVYDEQYRRERGEWKIRLTKIDFLYFNLG